MEKKKVNYTLEEKGLLMELARKYKDVIENKKTDRVSVHRKKLTWRQVAQEFNCQHGVRPRTQDQLKKCWKNLKEKYRKGTSCDTRERFKTGGGSPPRKKLTDELEQVGAIASHMNKRLDSPVDRDRMRHQNGTAASQDEVPPRASSTGCSSPLPHQTYTPGVMALLQPSQPIPVSEEGGSCSFWTSDPPSPPAVAGGEDMDEVPAACTAEVEDTSPAFLASSHSSRPARRSVAAASPPIISQAKQQLSVSDELRARMASVTKEDSRKNQEHLLRMRLLRTESRDKAEKRKQVHDLEVENLKAKR